MGAFEKVGVCIEGEVEVEVEAEVEVELVDDVEDVDVEAQAERAAGGLKNRSSCRDLLQLL